MNFRSGAAAYDRNYNLVFCVLGFALAAYFYYDYEIGYIAKNRAEAKKVLVPQLADTGVTFPEDGQLGAHPTQPEYKALVEQEGGPPREMSAVREALGEPLFSKPTQIADRPGLLTAFVSDYGMAQIEHVGDTVVWQNSKWIKWDKTKGEIDQQWYFMWLCVAFGAAFGYRTYRAATLTVEINDEGMRYAGKWVPKDSMRRLTDYSEKGLCNLFYDVGAGEQRIRFDNQKVRDFEGVIDALIALKGFDDPRPDDEYEEDAAEPRAENDDASESGDGTKRADASAAQATRSSGRGVGDDAADNDSGGAGDSAGDTDR